MYIYIFRLLFFFTWNRAFLFLFSSRPGFACFHSNAAVRHRGGELLQSVFKVRGVTDVGFPVQLAGCGAIDETPGVSEYTRNGRKRDGGPLWTLSALGPELQKPCLDGGLHLLRPPAAAGSRPHPWCRCEVDGCHGGVSGHVWNGRRRECRTPAQAGTESPLQRFQICCPEEET